MKEPLAPEFVESALLAKAGFRHAFFTRGGGVSEGPYASLNFSRAVGDRAERVAENIARAAGALGVDKARVYFLSQVHGAVTHSLGGTERPDEVILLEGDALVSADSTLACGVRSAD